MSLTDLLKGRKNITYQENSGINLAVYLISEFQDRTFTFKSLKRKYFGLSAENLLKKLQDELDSMLILYSYTTKVKTFTDKKGISQARIKLVGRAGTMSRYNPLDIELEINTET